MRPAALLALLLLFCPAARADDEVRAWKDATGKFSITAKFVSLSGGKVTLEKPDGSRFEIALEKLSPADRALAEEKAKAGDDPFTPKPKPAAPEKPAVTDAPVDWSKARLVGLASAPDAWKYEPAAPEPAFGPYLDPIGLPAKTDFFDKSKGVAASAVAARAATAVVTGRPGQKEATTRLSLIDLAAGTVLATHTVPGDFAPLAVSDDGSRVLVRREEFGFGNSGRLEVWAVDAAGVTKVAGFAPYADGNGPEKDVKWAAFVADGRLATVSGGGKLAVWDAATLKPLFYLPTARDAVPAVAPDRKTIAFATDADIGLLDAGAGKVVALTGAPGGHGPQLAFSPSGKRLARLSHGKLTVFDATTGAASPEAAAPPAGSGSLVWAGETHLLIDGRTLVDAGAGHAVWDYTGASGAVAAGGLVYFAFSPPGEGSAGALVPARLPGARVVAAAAKAMAEPDFVCLKAGTVVKINAEKIDHGGQRDRAIAALTEKLTANGQTVGDDGSIELVAEMEEGKTRELSFRDFGMPRNFPGFGGREPKTYPFTPHFSRVKFVYRGKVAWQAGVGGEPFGMVRLGPDETLEQYLKKLEKPNYTFFRTVQLPKTLTKPGPSGTGAAGSSQVTAAGVR